MCYTGQCKYEKGYGDRAGECKLPFRTRIPEDAACIISDEEMELREEQLEYEREMFEDCD
jgi:hypothetical protein